MLDVNDKHPVDLEKPNCYSPKIDKEDTHSQTTLKSNFLLLHPPDSEDAFNKHMKSSI